MKNYLITGGAGFIGSHLVENLLLKGEKVIIIDNFNDYYHYKIKAKNLIEATKQNENKILKDLINNNKLNKKEFLYIFQREINKIKNFKLYVDDIRNFENMENIFSENNFDFIIHLAAMAGVRPSFENIALYEKVNIKGTLNILEIMKKYKLNKFICASSSSVYGNNVKLPFSESDTLTEVLSPYAFTKKACEELSYLYYKNYNISVIMLRFFTVYGPRQRPDLAIHKFLNNMKYGKEIALYGNGESARDYTFIDDIISGISGAINYMENNPTIYEIFNLGESEKITLKEMIETLERKSKYTALLKYLPFQRGDMVVTFANIDKAKKLINYNPKTSFEKGIEKFVLWFENLI